MKLGGINQVDKQQFMDHVEHVFDTYELKPGNIFMTKFMQLNYDYDDELRECIVTCPISEILLNPAGIVHGGIYTYLADTAMGHLNFRYKDVPYVTLEIKTSFYKAISSGRLIARGRYTKEGYKVSFMEAEVCSEDGELLCKASGTFYRYEKGRNTK